MGASGRYPLAIPHVQHDEAEPYKGDLFGRSELGSQLTEIVEQLAPTGGVIAIDANWGDGKSWFDRNWKSSLKRVDIRLCCLMLLSLTTWRIHSF